MFDVVEPSGAAAILVVLLCVPIISKFGESDCGLRWAYRQCALLRQKSHRIGSTSGGPNELLLMYFLLKLHKTCSSSTILFLLFLYFLSESDFCFYGPCAIKFVTPPYKLKMK